MNCYITFWDNKEIVTLKVDMTEQIKVDSEFFYFFTETTYEIVPTENVMGICFN